MPQIHITVSWSDEGDPVMGLLGEIAKKLDQLITKENTMAETTAQALEELESRVTEVDAEEGSVGEELLALSAIVKGVVPGEVVPASTLQTIAETLNTALSKLKGQATEAKPPEAEPAPAPTPDPVPAPEPEPTPEPAPEPEPTPEPEPGPESTPTPEPEPTEPPSGEEPPPPPAEVDPTLEEAPEQDPPEWPSPTPEG